MNFKTETPVIIAALRELALRETAATGVANTTISEAAERLEKLETERAAMVRESNDICELVKFNSVKHDSLAQAVAAALDAPTEYKSARLEALETTRDFLLNEYNDISKLVNFNPAEHDSLTNAVAIALDANSKHTVLSAIEHLQNMLSGIFRDDTKIVIYENETPEIIINTKAAALRYEIPTASSKETDQFIESLSWISGQYIETEEAA